MSFKNSAGCFLIRHVQRYWLYVFRGSKQTKSYSGNSFGIDLLLFFLIFENIF